MPVTVDSQLEGKVIWATLCYSKQRGSPNKKDEEFDVKKRAEPLFRKRLRQTTSWKRLQSALPLPDHNLSIRADPGKCCCWRLVVLLCVVPSSSLVLRAANPKAQDYRSDDYISRQTWAVLLSLNLSTCFMTLVGLGGQGPGPCSYVFTGKAGCTDGSGIVSRENNQG